VHAEDARLAAALDLFAREGARHVLSVGDLSDGHGDLDRTCALLSRSGVLAVRGNHDRWVVSGTMRTLTRAHDYALLAPGSRDLLASLPSTRTFETSRGRLLLCHGVGVDDMQKLSPDTGSYDLSQSLELQAILADGTTRWVVGGHTHKRMVRRIGHVTFLNAGTLHREFPACVLVLDLEESEARFYDVLEGPTFVLTERIELTA
jgi:predicted phosphodiesterase